MATLIPYNEYKKKAAAALSDLGFPGVAKAALHGLGSKNFAGYFRALDQSWAMADTERAVVRSWIGVCDYYEI